MFVLLFDIIGVNLWLNILIVSKVIVTKKLYYTWLLLHFTTSGGNYDPMSAHIWLNRVSISRNCISVLLYVYMTYRNSKHVIIHQLLKLLLCCHIGKFRPFTPIDAVFKILRLLLQYFFKWKMVIIFRFSSSFGI